MVSLCAAPEKLLTSGDHTLYSEAVPPVIGSKGSKWYPVTGFLASGLEMIGPDTVAGSSAWHTQSCADAP